jgi:oxygen-independent coproporphyrinogen-3 oxidase
LTQVNSLHADITYPSGTNFDPGLILSELYDIHQTIETLAPKYQRPGPRYTSYPTAPHMRSDFEFGRFQRLCAEDDAHAEKSLSLYVHIPFCRSICYYCACNKVVTRKSEVSAEYLDSLSRELEGYRDWGLRNREISQLHWGGGTPTFLSHSELTQLMHLVARHFNMSNAQDREYSIEIDPRTVDGQSIALLRGLGFNRLSLGIQDFDPMVQQAINRQQPFEQVRRLTDAIRDHNFKSLSFDLIYGLPHQSERTMARTLERVIELSPDRIACYNYAHLPNRFPSQRAIDRLALPTAAQRLRLQMMIDRTLENSGYELLGLDHYVKRSDELSKARHDGRLQRNFQGYSLKTTEDMLGLGHSAISQIGSFIVQNQRTLDGYLEKVNKRARAWERALELTKDDLIRRDIIMDICCKLSFSPERVCERYGESAKETLSAELSALQPLVNDGLLVRRSSAEYEVSGLGRHFLRNICMTFDAWLDQTPVDIKYSKTV